ncbi:hypothetical protein [Fusibacter sp. 3D3]|uniref:hypothetical protein n=1 Tax=Fusibacter sp. 3D3 TaxID=1048380 RepID=UPI00085343CB|nr:hypothetical protein [Fusibacter sp. 3D3]GAU75930.1 hypothetical protein F3D3_0526 [Fusibacter sp. 3D3]
MKRSKKRSIGILILFLSIVFIIGVYSINTNTQNRHLQVAMSIYEQNESDFLHLVTDKNSITFNLDIAYNTSTNQTLRLYLLSNFQLAPYSLNGKPPSLKNELHLESSNNIQVTKGNQIVINNLNARKNDLSLLLVSDSMIATKRFQIDNVNGEVLALVPKVELIPSEKNIYDSYQVATVDRGSIPLV